MGCRRTKRLSHHVPRWHPPCGQPRRAPFKRRDRLVSQPCGQRADVPLRHPKRRLFVPLLCRRSRWPMPRPPPCQNTHAHAPWRRLAAPLTLAMVRLTIQHMDRKLVEVQCQARIGDRLFSEPFSVEWQLFLSRAFSSFASGSHFADETMAITVMPMRCATESFVGVLQITGRGLRTSHAKPLQRAQPMFQVF